MDTKKYPDNKTGYIRFAYDQLSDDDKIEIDIQVKCVLDFYKRKNSDSTPATHRMSRDGALEFIFACGRYSNGERK